MRLLLLFGVCSAFLAAPASASAGAFGVEMGTPLSELRNVQPQSVPGLYKVAPPKPHSEFETYYVVATPQVGVCKIVGVGKSYTGDRDGTVIRARAAEIIESLTTKYGSSKLYDFLHAGSIWKESNEWTMGLMQKERTYARFWNRQFASNLPEDLTGITLEVGATGPSSTHLRLAYEFTNMHRCLDPQKKKDDSSL